MRYGAYLDNFRNSTKYCLVTCSFARGLGILGHIVVIVL